MSRALGHDRSERPRQAAARVQLAGAPKPAASSSSTQKPTRGYLRRLKTTAAYAASIAGVGYAEFLEVVDSLGFRMVAGRLKHEDVRQILGELLTRTEDPERLERLQNAIDRLEDSSRHARG